MNTKSYIFMGALTLLMIIPMVSAYEVVTAKEPLDMVYLLVEQTFGGILITAVGMIIMFVILGMMSKMNPLTIMYFCLLFAGTFAIGYIGGVAAFLLGTLAIFYLWNAWKNYQNSGGGS